MELKLAVVSLQESLLEAKQAGSRAELRASALEAELASLKHYSEGQQREIMARLRALEKQMQSDLFVDQIGPVTSWVRAQSIDTSACISVVLPTYNRSGRLSAAVESVRSQAYENWQLIIIDDGSTDETPEVLQRLAATDDRILVARQTHAGGAAARNAALSRVSGEIVCYLDDDNLMAPFWLKAVAWSFHRYPNSTVGYGARVADSRPVDGPPSGNLPYLHFESFDRRRLELYNYIDLGVLAHRHRLPEARFDEALSALQDWEMILRLTEHEAPMPIPVVASHYSVDAPNRISDSNHFLEADRHVHRWMNRRHPLRLLAHNSLFPLLPETYIAAEIQALSARGIEVAWFTRTPTPAPVPIKEPIFTDLGTAIDSFSPDALFLHWASHADESLGELSRIGLPFGLRVHSFDFDLDAIERVRRHPLCIGIWAYPHHSQQIPDSYELVALVDPTSIPAPAADRPLVVSMSACLPKKDWPTLVAAFSELSDKGVDCRIITAVTDGFEHLPQWVSELIQDTGSAIGLQVDVPHAQVLELLAQTSAVVYTKVPGGPFGMPRSLIEGMLAAASVIVPDRPEALRVAGPSPRTYRSSADIVAHVSEIMAGGATIRAEQAANQKYALTNFADPDLGATFAAQLYSAYGQWRRRTT